MLSLASNELTGTFPSSVTASNKETLEYLNLYNNLLTGPLPTQVGLLSLLGSLDLHETLLSGSVSSELLLLPNVNKLTFYNTSLTGSIPEGLCRRLFIDENACSSKSPDCVSKWKECSDFS